MSAEIEQLDVIADLASKKFVGSGANGGVQTITPPTYNPLQNKVSLPLHFICDTQMCTYH